MQTPCCSLEQRDSRKLLWEGDDPEDHHLTSTYASPVSLLKFAYIDVHAVISIISDFVLAIFPIFILWKVQISTRIKAGLCGLMSLGLM